MILNIGNKKLNCVQVVQKNPVNNIYICEETDHTKTYVTVWEIKDRTIAKALLGCGEYNCYTYQDKVYFLFPYEESRLIRTYYLNVISEYPNLKQKILRECVIACMSSNIPYAILYLILKQGQINIGKDGSIHFLYSLNLQDFSMEKNEADCVVCCAKLMLELFQMESKPNKTAIALLEKKKKVYISFQELFRDICLLTETYQSEKKKLELKEKVVSKKDNLFRLMVWISGIIAVVALVMFFTNLVFGEIPFFRLFQCSFKQIGTESLLH